MAEATAALRESGEGRVERPESLREARDLLRDSSGAVLFRGGATKLDWGTPPERVDLVVDTSGMGRILEHNAADATAVVEAGLPLRRLQEELAAAGQWLAIDPPAVPAGATVGGILCADDAGPRRHRYGAMRDLVIGVTLVLADGSVGRSGGKVIKNVAGYDLPTLLCGSLGTLGLVARIVLRLHPRSRDSATVRVGADAGEATALALEVMASPVVASALDWARGSLWVRVEGHPGAVTDQTGAVRDLAAEHDLDDLETLTGDGEEAAWGRLVEGLRGVSGETVLRAGTLPSRLPEASRTLAEAAGEAGVEAGLRSHVGIGVHTARLRGGDPAAHARVVRGWRRRLAGHVVVRRRPPGLDDEIDMWGEPGPEIDLMRRIKDRFDPGRRCAPGRFVGGI